MSWCLRGESFFSDPFGLGKLKKRNLIHFAFCILHFTLTQPQVAYLVYLPNNLIIDNTKLKLFYELNKILQEQKVLDITSGYFNKVFFSEGLIASQIRTMHGKKEKFLTDMLDELSFISDEYSFEEDSLKTKINEITDAISNISFTKKRMQNLSRIWKEYKNSKKWHLLVDALAEFLKEKMPANELEIDEFDESKLRLICVQFVS